MVTTYKEQSQDSLESQATEPAKGNATPEMPTAVDTPADGSSPSTGPDQPTHQSGTVGMPYCQPPAHEARPALPSMALAGTFEPLPRRGLVALVDGLLKKPANVAWEISHGTKMFSRLTVVVVACMLVTGLVVGSFAGGFQLLAVPVKLALGFLVAALMCLPSLYILNCLSGSNLSLREVFGAQMMGLATVGILLLGFAPIGWVFSQSTASPVFMGVMYLIFFFLSCAFGLGLMKRVISAMGGRPFKRAWLWNIVFVLVALQLSTTLRPLFGEFDGLELGEKTFFLEHWFDTMAPAPPEVADLDVTDVPY